MDNRHAIRKVLVMDSIVTAITNVGFPIVMVLLMWYLFIHFYDSMRGELDKLRDTIDANTSAVDELCTHLDGESDADATGVLNHE
jgi:hypothetical protein